ncbi:molybdenum-dependent transcriptional regulator [Rodentibacter caecimuris]|uniref:Molybdenum-dependent transcriptional regulator n=1 Tax=Rodentibacter caecimuris TaxID=1796644 RepID=A0A9X8YYB8_9PAST|nr:MULTISPECIES: TOBE domain-containing protein [Pasteurellaceae]AOF52310.1 DNA-binding domain of ModE / Molybdate-binding domain of ModE [Pasteurellaceae bacterium NI1060]MCR1836361.1 TOBE domain-containing protein [Pasteurella caecimuris]MCU0105888.1 TOBE domain-containing protein [Pasteurella caecimuris]OOF72484.1 molybdenum-dependent transcriptional regulator [Rodentibacter heylii]OOF75012.1 molybdenum-dependent transcriptional regulator [Rodentibacter heylii]
MKNTEILLTIKLQQMLFIDPKRVRLLKEIQQCGSINQAAKNAKVSYKSAWDHLEAMNKLSPSPLLKRNTGGKNGGGTSLTSYAERLLQLYDLLEKTQEHAFKILQDESVPLDSLLTATARFSLQSSARNQLFGKVARQRMMDTRCIVDVNVEGLPIPLQVSITTKSASRLKLMTEKEVMLMCKAPWVKMTKQPLENQANQFPVNIKSINEEEAILVFDDSGMEFCATITQPNQWKIDQQIWLHIDPEQIILATLE